MRSGDAAAHDIGQRGGPARSGYIAQQQAGGPLRRPYGPVQHPGQSPVADMLPLGRRRTVRHGCRGLTLMRKLDMGVSNGMRPVYPGEILGEELGLSATALAKALDVPTNRVTAILKGQRGVTDDTALRLSRYFGTTPSSGRTFRRHLNCAWRRLNRGRTSKNVCNHERRPRWVPGESAADRQKPAPAGWHAEYPGTLKGRVEVEAEVRRLRARPGETGEGRQRRPRSRQTVSVRSCRTQSPDCPVSRFQGDSVATREHGSHT